MAKLGPSDMSFGESIDAAMFDAFAKRVMMPFSQFPAFKLRLIDGAGNIKKNPRTREEKRALSFIDRLAIMFKKYNAARNIQIANEYRLSRLNPMFMNALNRAVSYRLMNYHNINTGWDFAQMMSEEKLNKKKKIKAKKKQNDDQEKNKAKSDDQQLFVEDDVSTEEN
jgi:hypothetical protein